MTLDTAIDKYYNYVRSYICGKTGQDVDFADECCNMVFFLFSLKENKIADKAVYTWLLKTAYNKVREYYRKRAKESIITHFDDTSYLAENSPELYDLMVSDEEIEEAKNKILSLLSPTEREMYEDYFVCKMTYIEIANKLGIDRNTASNRLQRIKEKLETEAKKMYTVAGTVTLIRIISVLFDR